MSTFRKARSQKLILDIDFEQCLVHGSTVIEVEQDRAANYIYLCAQQLTIKSVSLGKQKAR
jgi:hypothetical protein